MAAPSPEVLALLNQLITATTGFKESHENFKASFKYCVSHLVHHTYPSVNKSAVQKTIEDLKTRFYTHGQFNLRAAFEHQVDKFLSCQETFKNNRECQIEWNLLCLVTSLASGLSIHREVPQLLPTEDEEPVRETFDWGAYLKEGLPVYHYESDSDNLSSLSSEEENPVIHPVPIVTVVTQSESLKETVPSEEFRTVLKKFRERKEKEADVQNDVETKGSFLLKITNSSEIIFNLTAEKELVDMVVRRLIEGGTFEDIFTYAVSFLSQKTLAEYFNEIAECARTMSSLNAFIKNVMTSADGLIVVKEYASCLSSYLHLYQLSLLDLIDTSPSLLRLMIELKQVLPFLCGLAASHECCVSDLGKEPSWKTSLRILSVMHNWMLQCHRADLRSAYLGMFLSCFSIFGSMIDTLFTSSTSFHSEDEFFFYRDTTSSDCIYHSRLCDESIENVPRFFKDIIKKVDESKIPLSIVYRLNRFASLENVPSVNPAVYKAIRNKFYKDISTEEEETDGREEVFKCFLSLNEMKFSGSSTDLLEIPRWVESEESILGLSKVVEFALEEVVAAQLGSVRHLAMSILMEECKLARHLQLLRNLLLMNDASLVLPFMQVFFNEESCWTNAYYLTSLLRECVSTNYSDLAENISVRVDSSTPKNIIDAIDSLIVEYKVNYPESLVISEEVIGKYKAIFKVLLKLKWAHTISHLTFHATDEMSVAARVVVHGLQILRFSCLTDLNIVINYFMAQVTTSLPHNINDYKDIQNLIHDHDNLINGMHMRCMLSPGDQNYSLVFDSIIPICFDLRNCWYLNKRHIFSRLKVMEKVRSSMHLKLMRLMPLLESQTYSPALSKLKEETATVMTTMTSVHR